MSLANLGRRSFVSLRGLQGILKDIAENGLPSQTSARSIKRAREKQLEEMKTTYGDIIQDMVLPLENGKKTITLPVVHPVAFLAACLQQCSEFSSFFAECHSSKTSSPDAKWKVVIYCDEVSPGNALKHVNERKLQTVYWSLAELGSPALSSESLWFTAASARSTLVRDVGGMGVFMRHLLDLFFGVPDFRSGIHLSFAEQSLMLWADLGWMIADEAAIKSVCGNKGAAGTVMCLQCQNCIDHKSELVTHDKSKRLVPSTCTDIHQFALHTAESVEATLAFLQEQESRLTKAAFARLQQSLGFNHQPCSILLHPAAKGEFATRAMYDWLHVYFVHGIANAHSGLFLGQLYKAGHSQQTIAAFMDSFQYPARLAGSKPKHALDKRKQSDPLKISASETMNVCIVLRAYVINYAWKDAGVALKGACAAFLQLVEVLDALLLVSKPGTAVSPSALQAKIVGHLEAYKREFGDFGWTPKFHMAIHLPLHYSTHGVLLSCFVHERKHKIVKRLANHVLDTTRAFERSILQDVVMTQMRQLNDASCVPRSVARICEKRPLKAPHQKDLREAFGIAAEIFMSPTAIHDCGGLVSKNDLAFFRCSGVPTVGLVHYHVEVDHVCFTCLSPWEHVQLSLYKVKGDMVLVQTRLILDTCLFSRRGDIALVLTPTGV